MHSQNEGRLALTALKNLLFIGGVECNPGPKYKVTSPENCIEGTSNQDSHEVQHLRKRVEELETQVLAANVLRVTELTNQKLEYEQRSCKQSTDGSKLGEWMGAAGRLWEVLPKDKLRFLVYFVVLAVFIFVLFKTGRKHHGHGSHLFWGRKH